MRIIAKWPDPRTGEVIDQSRDCGPGPFRDEYFMARGRTVARSAVDISQSDAPSPYGFGVVKNPRNSTAPSRLTFNGRRKK